MFKYSLALAVFFAIPLKLLSFSYAQEKAHKTQDQIIADLTSFKWQANVCFLRSPSKATSANHQFTFPAPNTEAEILLGLGKVKSWSLLKSAAEQGEETRYTLRIERLGERTPYLFELVNMDEGLYLFELKNGPALVDEMAAVQDAAAPKNMQMQMGYLRHRYQNLRLTLQNPISLDAKRQQKPDRQRTFNSMELAEQIVRQAWDVSVLDPSLGHSYINIPQRNDPNAQLSPDTAFQGNNRFLADGWKITLFGSNPQWFVREDMRGNLLLCFRKQGSSVLDVTEYILTKRQNKELLFLLANPEQLAKQQALAEVGEESDPRFKALFEKNLAKLKGQSLLMESLD